MKSVLVTGGTGFIGANLCSKLLSKGNKVFAMDNFITSTGENLKLLKKNSNFTFIKHDITHPISKTVRNQLSDVSCIYHLACPTGVPNLVKLAKEMLLACSLGTINILEFAKEKKAAVIFTSSSEVYGDPEKFPQKENYTGNVDSLGIRSPYEEGKRFSEALCAMYASKLNLDVKIVRVFNTYGPGSSPNESRVVPKFLRNALKNLPITVQGTGNQTRTFCYVDDLIDGLILLSKKGKKGEAYNLGSNKQISILDLANTIIKSTNSKSKIKFVKRPIHDHKGRQPDLSKIEKLGWKQKIDLKKGLLLTINAAF